MAAEAEAAREARAKVDMMVVVMVLVIGEGDVLVFKMLIGLMMKMTLQKLIPYSLI